MSHPPRAVHRRDAPQRRPPCSRVSTPGNMAAATMPLSTGPLTSSSSSHAGSLAPPRRSCRAARGALSVGRARRHTQLRCAAVGGSDEPQQQQPAAPALEPPAGEVQPLSRQHSRGLSLRYEVPWDVWFFIQVTAAVWVVNQCIPFAVLSSAASLQGLSQLAELPTAEKEVLGLGCQVLQLLSTVTLIRTATSRFHPLPQPWLLVDGGGGYPVMQAAATAIAAVGSGVLLSGVMTGHVDGAEEWRHLVGMHGSGGGIAALVLGAVVFAPLIEEFYFRGFVLPSLTKWVHPLAAVPLTGLLFASAHPADAFLPEALLGTVLSLSLLAADGNLVVPVLAHSLYNSIVLATEFLL